MVLIHPPRRVSDCPCFVVWFGRSLVRPTPYAREWRRARPPRTKATATPEIAFAARYMHDSRKAIFGVRYGFCRALELRSACHQHPCCICQTACNACTQCLQTVQSGARSAPHSERSASPIGSPRPKGGEFYSYIKGHLPQLPFRLSHLTTATGGLLYRQYIESGCSIVVMPQPSKLVRRVRFPSPAPF